MRLISKYSLLLLLLFQLQAIAQTDTSDLQGGKGEFYIINWIPLEDGVFLQEVILDYDYGIKDETPEQRFMLRWTLGDQVIIDGQRYKREEIGEDVFSKLRITEISFSSEVHSEDKFVSDLEIEYPNIIPRSGGESGWWIKGGPAWEELFEGVSAERAKQIYKKGFQLKNARILKIRFAGMEAVRDRVNELKEGLAVNKRPERGKRVEGSRLAMFFMDFDGSKKRGFRGLPWHVSLQPGISYMVFPMNLNNSTVVDTSGIVTEETHSYRKTLGMFILAAGVELWPFYGQNFGLGVISKGSIGGDASVFLMTSAQLGLKLHAGGKYFKGLGEYSKLFRGGTYKEITSNALSNGETTTSVTGDVDHGVDRIGLGTRFWFGKKHFNGIDAMLIFDNFKVAGVRYRASFFQLRLWIPHGGLFSLEFGSSYPAVGVLNYNTLEGYTPKGGYFMLRAAKAIDFFAAPSVVKRFRGKKKRK